MFAEPVTYSGEIAMRIWILDMGSEEAPAAFENLRRTGDTRSRQKRCGDAALCGPPGVQKLGLSSTHPSLEQPVCEAACDASGTRQCPGVEREQLARQIGRPKG